MLDEDEMILRDRNNDNISNSNSFANKLEDIQKKKNEEVDVEGEMKKMREEIAEARAAKNGENGDMLQFVNQIDNGLINGRHSDAVNGNVPNQIDVEMADKTEIIEANKPLKRRNYKKKLNSLDPSIDLTKTMESFTEILEDPGCDEMNNNENRDDVQNWFNRVNKHRVFIGECKEFLYLFPFPFGLFLCSVFCYFNF